MTSSANAGYDAARGGAAVALRADRAFLRVYGRDPVKMIHGLVTNDVTGAAPGQGVYAAMLTPKGKMVADLRVFRRDAELLLEIPGLALEDVTGTLRKFVPPLFARFEPVGGLVELGVYGPDAGALLARVLGGEPLAGLAEDGFVTREWNGEQLLVVRTLYTGDEGFDVIGSSERVAALQEPLLAGGAVAIDEDTLEVLRIEAGTPRWGAELDGNTIPLEAGLGERAISRDKGCYTGQEVIVRILHRGHVNWLLRGVLLEDAPLPARDAPLIQPADGRRIGRITSACVSPRQAQTIALAYVRRELEPPVEVRLERHDGALATIVELPFPVAGLGQAAANEIGA